jgi:hypothetical protein
MNDDIREIAKQLHETQTKYTEFLMAVAGACIALSVHRTTGVSPRWSMLILLLAVLFWASSIMAGVCNRQYFQRALHANSNLLRVHSGQEPMVGIHPQRVEVASTALLNEAEAHSNKASSYSEKQLCRLLIGSAVFLIWHVIEMFNVVPGKPI